MHDEGLLQTSCRWRICQCRRSRNALLDSIERIVKGNEVS